MPTRAANWIALAVITLALTPALAKNSQPILPQYILNARTVAVLIDPDAGISVSDPNANQNAQRDVESALLKWGRFTTLLSTVDADLIIVIRRGHDKIVDTTISDPRQNSRPGSVTRADDGISIGAQRGTPPPGTRGASTPQDGRGTAAPQTEIGNTDDSFQVFEGNKDYGASGAPAWYWIHKNGLHPHDVPAVDEFRKAIEAAEKAAAQKHP